MQPLLNRLIVVVVEMALVVLVEVELVVVVVVVLDAVDAEVVLLAVEMVVVIVVLEAMVGGLAKTQGCGPSVDNVLNILPVDCFNSPKSSLQLSVNSFLTSAGSNAGFASRRSATAPETWGHAMDVPLNLL